GLGVAVGVHDAVAAGLRHAGDPGTATDPVTENGGERPQVVLDAVAAARVGAGVGLAPACRGKELLGGRVDDFAPGGEQAYMRPVVHGGAGRSEEHTSGLPSRENLVCRPLLE